MTASLEVIGARLAAGERLTEAEVDLLAASRDLVTIGMLADEARMRRHGRRATFVRVFEVAVGGPIPGSPAEVPRAASEIRLVGKPPNVDDAKNLVRHVAAVADRRPITGFALDDLKTLARMAHLSLEALARHLREAGLESVAAVPIDRLDDPVSAIQAVLSAGLTAPRVTVSNHHASARLATLKQVSDLQRAAGTVRAFAPIARVVDPVEPSTGYDDLRQVALARLLVENVASIQVDWVLSGPKLAQVALTFGADDVDRVSPVDSLDLGARRAPLEEILRNIRAASLEPVERDGRFAQVPW